MKICKSNLTKKSANTETDREIERCLKNVKKKRSVKKTKEKRKKPLKDRQTGTATNDFPS